MAVRLRGLLSPETRFFPARILPVDDSLLATTTPLRPAPFGSRVWDGTVGGAAGLPRSPDRYRAEAPAIWDLNPDKEGLTKS
ncbi:hypothetical protein GCM10009735_49470 [Actinomadura chokoriensis]